jgi:DNA repair exonuclease SbcCD nuclease subunit
MKTFRFFHAADLHLGAFCSVRSDLADLYSDRLKRAPVAAFENMIELASQCKPLFIVLAGDVYDGFESGIPPLIHQIKAGFNELKTKGIEVYWALGNHDADINRVQALIDLPDNVHIFPADRVERIKVPKGGKPIAAVSGVSHAEAITRQNLSELFEPAYSSTLFELAVLHANVKDSRSSSEHDMYAPCTKNDLLNKHFSYWALGHIHKGGIVRDSRPHIVYPGNPQGLSWKESERGSKGFYEVEVDADTAEVKRLNFIECEDVIYETLKLDVHDVESDKLVDFMTKKISERQYSNKLDKQPLVLFEVQLHGTTDVIKKLKLTHGDVEDQRAELKNLVNEKLMHRKLYSYFVDNIVDYTRLPREATATPFNELIQEITSLAESLKKQPGEVIRLIENKLTTTGERGSEAEWLRDLKRAIGDDYDDFDSLLDDAVDEIIARLSELNKE